MFCRVIVALLRAAAAFGKRGAAEHGNDKCSRAWSYVTAHKIWRDGRASVLHEPLSLMTARLRVECWRRVRVRAATAMPLQTERVAEEISMRTPRSTREFASMLRTGEGFQRAPFGLDFGEDALAQCHQGHKRTALQKVPWWLALMELR